MYSCGSPMAWLGLGLALERGRLEGTREEAREKVVQANHHD